MKRLYTRIKSFLKMRKIKFSESDFDFIRLHLGTNSILVSLILFICIVTSFRSDVLNLNYLKGIDHDLCFFIGLFSTIFGVSLYRYWKLGEKSVYTIHFTKTKYLPKGVYVIFGYEFFSFGISSQIETKSAELSSAVRGFFCICIFLNLALITLDNRAFDKLIYFPSEVLESKSGYCPDKEEVIENAPPKAGCELIIRAYKLGYAKNLGVCEPQKMDPNKMKVCQKRREDEPYFHHMFRLLLSSIKSKIAFFDNNNVNNIARKFDLQLQKLEVLKDYQLYAISASPRASHHIWTNLPYPENVFVQKYREIFRPNYCIERFQNQTNTVSLEADDERKNSKLLEHVYGQLLFNPKSSITVGFCKEYKIHWNSDTNICEELVGNPKTVLQEEGVLSEVELVLKRHDIANVILSLDEEIHNFQNKQVNTRSDESKEKEIRVNKSTYRRSANKPKNRIVKNKIAKDKQEIRRKNELVSFQCFMQEIESGGRNSEDNLKLMDTNFLVRTRYFPVVEGDGESQISMYRAFSKLLEDRFYYSQLTSRSDFIVKGESRDAPGGKGLLEEPTYLFSRLEMLKNVDIFLGNNWVLERDDLMGIYPYHVHLQNYVDSFRAEYHKSRGRL